MDNSPAELGSFIGDIKKVLDEVKDISKNVARLPAQIADVPADSFRLFTDVRDAFDKAHVIRDRLDSAVTAAEGALGGLLDVIEKAGEDLLRWVGNAQDVATFRSQLRTFFDDLFEVPANAAKVNLPGLVGDLVDLPLRLDALAIPFEQTVVNDIIDVLPAELLYLIHLGVEHSNDWYELPGRLNDRLQGLSELAPVNLSAPAVAEGLNGNQRALIGVSAASTLCKALADLIQGAQGFASRDTSVGLDVLGEGIASTIGANPMFTTLELFRVFLVLLVDVFGHVLTVLAALAIK